jgi:choline kinase
MSDAVRNVFHPKNRRPTDVAVIIPTAGPGKRMVSYGPRPLIKIDNITVIEHQISIFRKAFHNPQIILVVGHDAYKIMSNTPDDIIKIENENYETTNVIRSIGMGLRATHQKHVVVAYGDLVFNEETVKVGVDKSLLIVDSGSPKDKKIIGCTVSDSTINHLDYDLTNHWKQIMVLTGKELKLFKKVAWNPANSHLFDFEAINQVINDGGRFTPHTPNNMKIVDIDTSKDINEAKEIV